MPGARSSHARRLSIVAVVEDDPPLLEAIRFSLSAEGYPVRLYDSGEALLAADGLDEVSCFVIDHRLPGIAGMALIEELQRRGLKGRVVMITTRPSANLREACWALGVPIVEKPILGESLNACIRGLLAVKRDV
ncbi:MAG TPA: response regulator [Caulobacteraceae bacterium]|nr:response regulator [Caulobacteraceae bacterium]